MASGDVIPILRIGDIVEVTDSGIVKRAILEKEDKKQRWRVRYPDFGAAEFDVSEVRLIEAHPIYQRPRVLKTVDDATGTVVSSVAPSSPEGLRLGAFVVVHGLVACVGLNGTSARIVGVRPPRSSSSEGVAGVIRYIVKFADDALKAIKATNLSVQHQKILSLDKMDEDSPIRVERPHKVRADDDGEDFDDDLQRAVRIPHLDLFVDELPYLYPFPCSWSIAEGCRVRQQANPGNPYCSPAFLRSAMFPQRNIDAHWHARTWVLLCTHETFNVKDETKPKFRGYTLAQCKHAFSLTGFEYRGPADVTGASSWSQEPMSLSEFSRRYGEPQVSESFRGHLEQGAPVRIAGDCLPVRCDHCHLFKEYGKMPQCECGEFFCSAECRLAEWENHKHICAQARTATGEVSLSTNRIWMLHEKGVTHDLEGRRIEDRYGSRAPEGYDGGYF